MCEAEWPAPTRALAEAGVITSFRRYFEQQLTAERHRYACLSLDLKDVFWTACVSVGGRLVHSQTINLAAWPEDGNVRLFPSDRSVSLGKAAVDEDGVWSPEELPHVEWTVVRRSDGKMAHLVSTVMTEGVSDRGEPFTLDAELCRLWTFAELAVYGPRREESSMPDARPRSFPYLEAEVRHHEGTLFLAELAIRFCPDDPEPADAMHASRDWVWIESALLDQVWR